MALWACVRDRVATPALLGFLADMVPVSVARAGGRAGAGTSLDNTLRFGPRATTSWVLVDLDPHLAHDGYGHGTVALWAPDGTLLATGSQTAAMLLFD
ncbi:MAG: thioesterase family protein, partial [Acidimicrobiia bacterium]|nr:thioesterase family protein [Acidimicrobiia bacterium]